VSSVRTIRETRPALTRADNFLAFWQGTLLQLKDIPSAIQINSSQSTDDGLLLKKLSFQSFGNAVIQAYFLTPLSNKIGPLIIYTHGYMGQCEVIWDWAKQGASVLGVDLRGFGKSQHAISNLSQHGYIITGIQSEDTSILRGAICDYIRAVDVARELSQGKQTNTIYYGKSFGGALASIAAALTEHASLLVAAVPTLSWAEGRRRLVTQGSGAEINAYIESHRNEQANIMRVLSYFDTMNFAPLIKCKSFIGMGLEDNYVPAETVYAFVNHLSCQKQVREFPVSHSNSPQERLWENFEKEWLQAAFTEKL
jgi:cephalosporin-C deacetylase-like acetyl esterase